MSTPFEMDFSKKFDELVEQTETDPQLKDEVFKTIAAIENASYIVELFTGKMLQSECSFVDSMFTKTDIDNTKV